MGIYHVTHSPSDEDFIIKKPLITNKRSESMKLVSVSALIEANAARISHDQVTVHSEQLRGTVGE